MPNLLVHVLVAVLAGAQSAAQVATGRVAGRVVDQQTGQPIPGVRVTLNRAPTTPLGERPQLPPPGSRSTLPPLPPPPDLLSQRPLMTETNSDGVFEISGVPQGRWIINAQKQGYIVRPAPSQPQIEAVAGRSTTTEIRLDRGGAIRGRVLDARGNPVSGLMVLPMQRRRLPNGTVQMTGVAGESVKTDDLGEYRLAGLPPGELYVVAHPPPRVVPLAGNFGPAPPPPTPTTHVSTYYPGVVDAAIASPVNVVNGGTTAAIDFTLQDVAAFQVAGIVVDAGGQPVAGAIVRLAPRASTPVNLSISGGPTDANGRFRVTNVPAGTYGAMAAVPVITRTASGGMSGSLGFGEAAQMSREQDSDHGKVWASTDRTAGRSWTMAFQWSPASDEA